MFMRNLYKHKKPLIFCLFGVITTLMVILCIKVWFVGKERVITSLFLYILTEEKKKIKDKKI